MSDGGIASAGSRREARERVLGLLYEADVRGLSLQELVDGLPLALDGYAATLMEGLTESLDSINAEIEATSHHWKVSRMPVVDRCVLRIGVFELLYRDDIPAGAAINEAVELAAEYSTAESSRFVNGILSRVGEDPDIETIEL